MSETTYIPITPDTPDGRKAWLDLRRQDVTASDIGVLAGASQYKTPLRLWAEKTGEVEEGEETGAMRRGRWLEDAVLNAMREQHPDWIIRKPMVYVRDAALRFGATPDALAYFHEGEMASVVIQCKVVARPVYEAKWLGDDGEPAPPLDYMLQTLSEAMLLNTPDAYLAALVIDTFNAELQEFKVARHDGAETKIRHMVRQFWSDIAQGRVPGADYNRDLGLLKELHEPDPQAPTLDWTGRPDIVNLLEGYEEALVIQKMNKVKLDGLNAQFIEMLGEASKAQADGWTLTRKRVNRDGYTVQPTSFTQMWIRRTRQ